MASFDEKVSVCLENINEFADSIKKVHDIYKCTLNHCETGMFSDDLHSYVNSKRRSSRLVIKFFLRLCEKYPQGFEDCFMVAKNGYLCLPAPHPGPGPRPQFVFSGPGPQVAFTRPG